MVGALVGGMAQQVRQAENTGAAGWSSAKQPGLFAFAYDGAAIIAAIQIDLCMPAGAIGLGRPGQGIATILVHQLPLSINALHVQRVCNIAILQLQRLLVGTR